MGSFFQWVIGDGFAKYLGRMISGENPLVGKRLTTVAEATTTLFTANMVLGGLINYDPTGGSATATMPTAALVITALGDAALVDTVFYLDLIHGGSTSEVVTLAAGAGNTLEPTTQAFDGAEVLHLIGRITNVGTPAITYHSLGLDLRST